MPVVLTLCALVGTARAQGGDPDQPIFQYGTPQGGLGVYADTAGHKVDVAVISQDAEGRGEFAAAKVLAWVDSGMRDPLIGGSNADQVSLVLLRQAACVLRLSETGHPDHEITVPCRQIPSFTDGMRIAAGRPPIFFDFQVEKQASTVPGSPAPTYPVGLRSEGIGGWVVVQFVVDTNGRADMSTFKVLKSAHEELSEAVRRNLPDMRFNPAEIAGHKVKQLVQEPFAFAVQQ